MEAIVINEFGDESVLKFQKIDIPKPGEKQALIKIFAAGVNPIDVIMRKMPFMGPANFPTTLGFDGAGVIEEAGPNSKWKKGDRVYVGLFCGTYAQFVVANDAQISALPDNTTFEEGAAISVPYRTAYHALFNDANATTSDLVLIHGASGAVGLAAVEFCKQKGIRVIGTAGTTEGLKLIKEKGCEEVFNHKEEGYVEKIGTFTEGKGVNVIFEMVIDKNVETDIKLLTLGGRLVYVGSKGGPVNFNPYTLILKNISFKGSGPIWATEEKKQEMTDEIFKGLSNKSLVPVISRKYALKDAAKAQHDIANSSANGKFVLLPWNN